MSQNPHNFQSLIFERDVVVGACTKCALKRAELLDSNGKLKGCEFGNSVTAVTSQEGILFCKLYSLFKFVVLFILKYVLVYDCI